MKKGETSKDTMRDEYRREDFPGGLVRGKYAKRAGNGSNIAVLEPEVAAAFPSSEAVNRALRTVLEAAKHVEMRVGQHPAR